MKNTDKIYVAGHNGMVGSAILRKLHIEGFHNIVIKNSHDLDLRNQSAVNTFFEVEKPDYVFLSAAKVGGIMANITYKAEFIYDNLMIESNVIHASYLNQVKKLLFLGSSCIYPKLVSQPIKEEFLLQGPLEPTNEPYAIAKIAGIKLCEAYRSQYNCNFISIMPTNLYGPNDNYDLQNSHVLPALIRKFHQAKKNSIPSVEIWGTGSPLREFLHVDDMSNACIHLMQNYDEPEAINVGVGKDITVKELALIIKDIIGYKGDIEYDFTKPDGTPRKLLDISKLLSTGWSPNISLIDGIKSVYQGLKNEPWY